MIQIHKIQREIVKGFFYWFGHWQCDLFSSCSDMSSSVCFRLPSEEVDAVGMETGEVGGRLIES